MTRKKWMIVLMIVFALIIAPTTTYAATYRTPVKVTARCNRTRMNRRAYCDGSGRNTLCSPIGFGRNCIRRTPSN